MLRGEVWLNLPRGSPDRHPSGGQGFLVKSGIVLRGGRMPVHDSGPRSVNRVKNPEPRRAAPVAKLSGLGGWGAGEVHLPSKYRKSGRQDSSRNEARCARPQPMLAHGQTVTSGAHH